MVPSLPDRLKCPEMPSDPLIVAVEAKEESNVASGVFSTNPAPKTGVGMRKMTLLAATAAAKSGCVMLHPGASVRPLMTKRSCTPPSGVPSGLFTNRASRTGPSAVMKDGRTLNGGFLKLTCGFGDGLLPPTAGCRWQPEHWSRLNRGPKPAATSSTSWKTSLASVKKFFSSVLRSSIMPPAPGAPPRTPGSCTFTLLFGGLLASSDWAEADPDKPIHPTSAPAMPVNIQA